MSMPDYETLRRAMVDCQVRPADVTRYWIIEAMLGLPRERFVPRARRPVAYAETEVEVASDRFLLAPRTFAKMVEAASVLTTDLVLDLAPGTGYSTAVLARRAEAVVAVEPSADLVSQAAQLFDELEVVNAAIAEGSPAEGDDAHGPYDVIFINGAVEQVPAGLLAQLKQGGRLVAIFREGAVGQCRVLIRSGSAVSERTVFDATAPLVGGFERAVSFAF